MLADWLISLLWLTLLDVLAGNDGYDGWLAMMAMLFGWLCWIGGWLPLLDMLASWL
jgi:hypothetical protein